MAEPSKPMPSANAPSSSAGATAIDFSVPRTSVNHSRTNLMSRSSSVRSTNSSCLSTVFTLDVPHPCASLRRSAAIGSGCADACAGRYVLCGARDRGRRAAHRSRGDAVHPGKTGTALFPGLARLTGDRDTGDYALRREGSWDAVVDCSGYVPRHVRQAMDALGERAGRYLFISSHAVYQIDGIGPGSNEDTPRRPPVRDTEELTDETYGPLKVACEDDVVARYGARATIVRPGKVAGPHDWQPGLTYWVRRAARGGRVALPGDPAQPVQIVDSRDLARLVVQLLTDDRPGAFHAVGPATPVTLGGLIGTCARAGGTSVEIVPVPP